MMNQAIPSPSEPSSVRPTELELLPVPGTSESYWRPWLPRGALIGASLLIQLSLGLMLFSGQPSQSEAAVEPRLVLLIASLLPPLLAWLSYPARPAMRWPRAWWRSRSSARP